MSVVTELEAALQAMQNSKAPGVSGSKIVFITELSVNNVQSESVIIQKLYTHFKKCPGTHKLGPLYVVDSIARRYLDQAKKNHQEVSAAASDGTFAAGIVRITNLLPALMSDILQHAPAEENKVRCQFSGEGTAVQGRGAYYVGVDRAVVGRQRLKAAASTSHSRHTTSPLLFP